MILLTEIVVIAMAVILFWHAVKEHGRGFAILFWSCGAVLGLLREWTVINFTPLYEYGDFTLQIGGLPLIMAVFWSNFAYVALQWTSNIGDRNPLESESVDDLLPFVFLILAVISIAVEAYASQFEMIIWKAEPVLTLWGGTPVIVPFGYGAMGVLFLLAFRGVWRRWSHYPERAFSLFIFLTPFIILLQLGFLFTVKVIIGLLFSGS